MYAPIKAGNTSSNAWKSPQTAQAGDGKHFPAKEGKRMNKKTMMAAGAAGAAAAMMVTAGAVSMASTGKNGRKMKKVAKKVAKGAEKAVMDLDKMVGRYYH